MTDRLEELIREIVRDELRQVASAPSAAEELLSVDEACKALGGISRSTLYAELAAGRLRSLNIGKRRIIPSSAIAEYAATAR